MMSTIVSWFKNRLLKKLLGNTVASATTVVAVRFGSGVVLGTDGRLMATEFGLIIQNACEKIVQIGDWIAVGCSGDAIFIDMLNKQLANDLAGKNLSVTEVAREVKVRMENHIEVHSTHIGILVVGLENNKWPIIKLETVKKAVKKAQIVRETRVGDDVRYASVGSGSQYVRTYVNKKRMAKYPLNTKDVELRRKVVLKALKCAVLRDWGSGGRLQVVSIDPENGCNDYHEYQKGGSGCCDSEYKYKAHGSC